MDEMGIKKKVLDEMIKFMDEQDGEKLKKHPKVIAMMSKKTVPAEEMNLDECAPDEMSEDEDMELSPELLKKLIEKLSGG